MLSRVADACFWMSRYIERAETNARLLDVNMQLLLDFEDQNGETAQEHWEPILATLEDQELFASIYPDKKFQGDDVMEFVTFQRKNPNSILSCIAGARENARMVREQISSEMWEQLNRLHLYLGSETARQDYLNSPYDFYKSVIEGSHLFQGITDATMTHGEGWLFIQTGKLLERADSTSRVLDVKYHILLPHGEQVGGTVDLTQWMAVLRSCSAMEAFLKVHVRQVTAWKVAEFLILHRSFPRSIRSCVDRLDDALHQISGNQAAPFCNEAERLCGLLRSHLDYATINSIMQTGLHEYLDDIQFRLNEISNATRSAYCEWLDGKLTQQSG